MEKRWVLKEQSDASEVALLSDALGIDRVLANLLIQRGVKTFEQAKTFFRPTLDSLYDPFLMKDMDKAVVRIEQAIEKGEKILVYGDYDVDGTTAVALMYSFLSKLTDKIAYYIPNRYSEGYGVSIEGVTYAADNGFTLIVALDCGIKAVEKVAYAREHGVDFIICDHHLPGDTIPNAAAVLDPKRIDCNYPFKELSGCGVGFKLAQAYSQYKGIPFSELEPLLDMVAVSIASDIVPLTGENRVLAHFGLKRLNENPSRGLLSIIKLAGLVGHSIAVDDIVFKIGPRINAAGRMESGKAAVDLLLADCDLNAFEMGEAINICNNDRKEVDRGNTLQAIEIIQSSPELQKKKSTVLFNPTWHKGVVGIVASRLIDYYYRPTIVLTASNGFATGSARSVPGFDLYQAIDGCSDLLENFGGHMYAAGLTMKEENVPAFIERFESIVAASITDSMMIPMVEIDSELKLSDITEKFFRILKQFQPFGPGNMSPVFISSDVVDNGDGRLVGADHEHLKLDLIQEDNPYKPVTAIGFQQGIHYDHISKGKAFNACYSIAENTYRGVSSLQVRIRDIKY